MESEFLVVEISKKVKNISTKVKIREFIIINHIYYYMYSPRTKSCHLEFLKIGSLWQLQARITLLCLHRRAVSLRIPQKIEYNSSENLHFVRFQDGAGGSVKI